MDLFADLLPPPTPPPAAGAATSGTHAYSHVFTDLVCMISAKLHVF